MSIMNALVPRKFYLSKRVVLLKQCVNGFLNSIKTDINSTVNSEEPNQLASSETT